MHCETVQKFLENWNSDVIHFTTSNAGGKDLAMNLGLSCMKSGLPIVFFGNDGESLDGMEDSFSATVDNSRENKHRLSITKSAVSNHAKFGSNEFHSVAWLRYELILQILESGRSAIYMDTDIVVKRNYEEDILSYLNKNNSVDGVVQMNHVDRPCTGFLGFHPRSYEKMKNIYNEPFLEQHNYKNMGDAADQDFFHKVICPTNDLNLLNIQLLSRDLYPNGAWWYKRSKFLHASAKLVHYNCIVGQDNKISKMKEYGDWFVAE